ncbi:MAG TPA: mannosyltransferase family protein, partial [Polyangiaceae bacterium]|nr:mannosyltransferase family protein [Polyangiaceae bacterium]
MQPGLVGATAAPSHDRPFGAAERWLRAAATPRFVGSSWLAVWVAHAGLWLVLSRLRGFPFVNILLHYDAGWYFEIASKGYTRPGAWAFYPLWPIVIRLCSPGSGVTMAVAQTLLAMALFAASVALYFTKPGRAGALAPSTRLGWLFFILAPAAYIFHSGHTESLFLLLSLSAFAVAASGRFWIAACLAGLCALTRNQGVFVAVAIALAAGQAAPPGRRALHFALAGVIGAAWYALYPLYQYVHGGDATLFMKAQSGWAHATGPGDALRTLVLGNAVKPWEYATRVHHPWFLGALVGSYFYYRERGQLPLVVYFVASALV